MNVPSSSATGVAWNLADLYAGVDDPAIDKDLETALERARRFEATYRGKIGLPEGPEAETLLAAVTELEAIAELLGKVGSYAGLLHSAKTDDPQRGALLAKVEERSTAVHEHLIFFDLEWFDVEEEAAQRLISCPTLAKYRHYLEKKRVWKPHHLSEAEEKLHDKKSITGRSAFVRLFDETVSAIRFPYEQPDGTTAQLSQQEILAKLYDPERSVRRRAAAGLTKGLRDNSRLLTYIFNTVVLDHKIDCELRRFTTPMQPRHLANEIKPETVDALMTAVERFHPTVHRYYRLKGKLLGIEQLYDYDRYAPLSGELPSCPWERAREIVLASYQDFSPQAGAIAREFFEKHWIDAELRPGKRGGAFSHGCVPSVHPYILVNYTDKLRDVMTLAHELGHGIHQYLSRKVGYLQAHTPLTTAETASVFGEMLTFQRLQHEFPDPKVRLALLCSKIEDAFATVFRQIVLTRFEQALHKARAEMGELPTDRINELWMQANLPMHGDAVRLTEDYGWWWEYIGHFIHVPFYCYAYAFGELLVLALYQKYREEGAAFVPKYLEMLSAGGAEAPARLLAPLGVDVDDPQFWEKGLRLLDGMVTDAEQLAHGAQSPT